MAPELVAERDRRQATAWRGLLAWNNRGDRKLGLLGVEARDSWLRVAWVPQQRNDEAGARTNGCFVGFNLELRWVTVVEVIKWKVMGALLQAGGGTAHKRDRLRQVKKAPRQRLKEAVRRRRKVMAGCLRIGGSRQWWPGLSYGLLEGGFSARVARAMVGVAGILVIGVLQSPVGWGFYDCIPNSVLIGLGHFPMKKGYCHY